MRIFECEVIDHPFRKFHKLQRENGQKATIQPDSHRLFLHPKQMTLFSLAKPTFPTKKTAASSALRLTSPFLCTNMSRQTPQLRERLFGKKTPNSQGGRICENRSFRLHPQKLTACSLHLPGGLNQPQKERSHLNQPKGVSGANC